MRVIMKSIQVYTKLPEKFSSKKKVCVLKLVMAWEALLRRFSRIMLSGPYQTQLSVLMTSLSPQTLSHRHTFFLSLQAY